MSPDELNALINDPVILKQLGYEWLDLTGFFARPGNIALGDKDGAALFAAMGDDGVYMGHYIFPPHCRGKAALEKSRAFLKIMFTTHGARLIVGETPLGNISARCFSRALGFTRQGTTASNGRSCVIYHMERDLWATLSAESSVA